jgi:hypothetical protein
MTKGTTGFVDWLERHARWSMLKGVGSSGLVRASVLMPAFGYMLLLNQNARQFLTIEHDGWLAQHLSNVWRIWFLFYGSFFLAMATVLYSAFCPRAVKHYNSGFVMADEEADHHFNLGRFDTIRNELQAMIDKQTAWEARLYVELGNSSDLAKLSSTPANVAVCLLHRWAIANVTRPTLRVVIAVLFAAGLTLITIPACVTFLQVTALLM